MDNKKHFNELILLSQEIYDVGSSKLTDYCTKTYSTYPHDAIERQLEDYLFVAEETSAYFLGNALALLDADSQETEIKTFVENLRRVIAYAQQKMERNQLPN
ncbi:MAG: hypothetical protein K6A68_14615 [Clostridiales bacterium]|nr:hypothetical protein [Clostridiales bacterium]